MIALLRQRAAVGIGHYAEARLREVAPPGLPIERVLHPSPANPRALKEFAADADRVMDWAARVWTVPQGAGNTVAWPARISPTCDACNGAGAIEVPGLRGVSGRLLAARGARAPSE